MWESPVEEFEGLDLRYPNLDTDEAYLRVNYSGLKGKYLTRRSILGSDYLTK